MSLYVALPLAALILAAVLTWLCYRVAFGRHTPRRSVPVYEEPKFAAYADALREGDAAYAALPFEAVEIESFDGLKLRGRVCGAQAGRPMMLLFHGWRSSAARDFGCVLEFYRAQGFALLLVDQRAQGASEGRSMTFGVCERYDCLAWARWAQECYHPSAMYLDGISMGASTVLMASCLDLPASVRGIIADCGFTSPREILRKVIAQLHLPVGATYFFVRLGARVFGHFDPEAADAARALEACRVPVLFVHGETDGFVPHWMSQENFRRCAAPKRLITVPGAEHGLSYLVDRPGVEAALKQFFAQTRPEGDADAAQRNKEVCDDLPS